MNSYCIGVEQLAKKQIVHSPLLCFKNIANTHQVGVHANVMDKTIRVKVHRIYVYLEFLTYLRT